MSAILENRSAPFKKIIKDSFWNLSTKTVKIWVHICLSFPLICHILDKILHISMQTEFTKMSPRDPGWDFVLLKYLLKENLSIYSIKIMKNMLFELK